MSSIPLFLKVKRQIDSQYYNDYPCFDVINDNSIEFNDTKYDFEYIYNSNDNNYHNLIESSNNSCIVLMGPTNSGKTTMLKQLINLKLKKLNELESPVFISSFEISNNKYFTDLLDITDGNESKKIPFSYITNFENKLKRTKPSQDLIRNIFKQRLSKQTEFNENSSRSCLIMTFFYNNYKTTFVDLMGNEKNSSSNLSSNIFANSNISSITQTMILNKSKTSELKRSHNLITNYIFKNKDLKIILNLDPFGDLSLIKSNLNNVADVVKNFKLPTEQNELIEKSTKRVPSYTLPTMSSRCHSPKKIVRPLSAPQVTTIQQKTVTTQKRKPLEPINKIMKPTITRSRSPIRKPPVPKRGPSKEQLIIQNLQNEQQQLKQKYLKSIDDIKMEISGFKTESSNLVEAFSDLKENLIKLENENLEKNQIIESFEQKIVQLTQELETSNQEIKELQTLKSNNEERIIELNILKSNNEEQINELKSRKTTNEEQISKLESNISKLEEELMSNKDSFLKSKEEQEILNNQINKFTEESKNLTNRITSLNEIIVENKQILIKRNAHIVELEEKIELLNKIVDENKQVLNDRDSQIDKLRNEASENEQTTSRKITDLENQIKSNKIEFETLTTEKENFKSEKIYLEAECVNMKNNLDLQKTEKLKLISEIETYKNNITNKDTLITDKDKIINDLKNSGNKIEDQIHSKQQLIEDLEKKIADKDVELKNLNNSLTQLQGKLNKANVTAQQLNSTIETRNSEILKLREQFNKNLNDKKSEFEKDKQTWTQKLNAKELSIIQKTKEIEQLQTSLKKESNSVKSLQLQTTEKDKIQEELTKQTSINKELSEKYAKLKTRSTTKTTKITELEQSLKSTNEKISQLETSNSELMKSKENLNKQLKQTEDSNNSSITNLKRKYDSIINEKDQEIKRLKVVPSSTGNSNHNDPFNSSSNPLFINSSSPNRGSNNVGGFNPKDIFQDSIIEPTINFKTTKNNKSSSTSPNKPKSTNNKNSKSNTPNKFKNVLQPSNQQLSSPIKSSKLSNLVNNNNTKLNNNTNKNNSSPLKSIQA
ncbi:uncharacterized protein KGF55_003596 [Candida pseudojiufengensis]|uniref:uncharacterized protein n=1 Tax=Candida pseudojiufengensis TaxID=497109 RepID=UPI002224D203|nr:uncharacterized protein KGF55_003596 [Candida pseudojiufengensis]KAI5962520.1 hypothetical protein KGF55_003596 [Candida pseudojiufengensis]